MRFMLFDLYEMTGDFLVRFHAFGSLCDFLMTLFFVLLDNCLMRFDAFFLQL